MHPCRAQEKWQESGQEVLRKSDSERLACGEGHGRRGVLKAEARPMGSNVSWALAGIGGRMEGLAESTGP